jgi:hypothetical protein
VRVGVWEGRKEEEKGVETEEVKGDLMSLKCLISGHQYF